MLSQSSTHIFGKPIVIITDHKPLLMIHSKPLKSAPPRLQRLRVKIQGYDFQFVYLSGKQMIIADVISRLCNSEKNAEIPLDVTVDGIVLDVDENACSIDMINSASTKECSFERCLLLTPHLRSTTCSLQRMTGYNQGSTK